MQVDTSAPQRQAAFVARQPILDNGQRVFGYELLYRDCESAIACTAPSDTASARVLTDSVLNLGLEALTGGHKAFVNLSRSLLIGDAGTLLPPSGVVVELLEDIEADPEVIDACRELKSAGYALALDDFTPGSGAERLLPYVKYVKLDVLATAPEVRAALARRLLPRGIRLLAEKVETREMFAATEAEGYTLFQGYFFCRPATLRSGALPSARMPHLRILAAINEPDLTVARIEDIVKHEAALSYRLLRCVNSAAAGIHREIHSIRQAILLIGIEQIRRWASVWAMAGLNGGGSPEVVTTAILRGRCCEVLGTAVRDPEYASALFLLGLCSLLDTMLERPMSAVVDGLPLNADTRKALLGDDNPERRLLDAVIACERGAWESAAEYAACLGISNGDLASAYADALRWGHDIARSGLI
jgi:EAL and modified HD-GYP domain-containing signal transduction protein